MYYSLEGALGREMVRFTTLLTNDVKRRCYSRFSKVTLKEGI
jgi:hypothetical protein